MGARHRKIEDVLHMDSETQRVKVIDWFKPKLNLYQFGDTHQLFSATDVGAQREAAEELKNDPFGLGVHLGDWLEGIDVQDWRFDASEMPKGIKGRQLRYIFKHSQESFLKTWEPAFGKFTAGILGNHDTKAEGKASMPLVEEICEDMSTDEQECTLLGGTHQCGWLLIRLHDTKGKVRYTMRVFMIHGWGGGRKRGSASNKLEDVMLEKDADIIMMGHHHKPVNSDGISEYVNNHGKCIQKPVMLSAGYPMIGLHGYYARIGKSCPPVGFIRHQIELTSPIRAHRPPRVRTTLCRL